MKLSTQSKDLKKKIRKEHKFKEYKQDLLNDPFDSTKNLKITYETSKKIYIVNELRLLEKLIIMINEGATGFDLAYEIERTDNIRSLVFEGINLISTCKRYGNKVFKDEPDEVKNKYESFITLEESAKSKIIKWINKAINKRKSIVRENKEIFDYLKEALKKEKIEAIDILNKLIIRCEKCGAKIINKQLKYCENCGSKVRIN